MKKITIYFAFLFFFIPLYFTSTQSGNLNIPDSISAKTVVQNKNFSTPWVDSVFKSLSLEQRIAQLLMIEVSSNQNRTYYNRIERIIKTHNIGGIIFFKGNPSSQLNLTNSWQKTAQTPLFVAMDAEWGLSMRLDSTISFPRQITLGAISNERLVYELGLEMGRQCRRMGVHINFSPVIDVNSNPSNPVINSRSFGECRYNVSRKGMALMLGMQDAGIIATAKHFPGHGDTDVDSHHALPMINHPLQQIDSIHLFPFRHLIDKGLKGIMAAHLNIPSLEPILNLPSSLSKSIITDLLQKEMGFNGLVFTDALNMKGVTDSYRPGDLEVMALLAGNDILLMPENVHTAINAIKKAIEKDVIDEEIINIKCRKVLYFKEQSGLNNRRALTNNNLLTDLNSARALNLNRRLAEASITVISNKNDILPLKELDTLQIAALSIGAAEDNPFQAMLNHYAPVKMLSIPKNHTAQQAEAIMSELNKFNLVIISVQNNTMFPGRNYGVNNQTIELINKISSSGNVILNVFASPYSLMPFGNKLQNIQSILISYQDGRDYEEASAQIIFGAISARGKLPVSISPFYSIYSGINTPGRLRIKYINPESSGYDPNLLHRIDSIALAGINEQAYPGCQIAVIKDGEMIYNKSFGYHTYDNNIKVKNSDIYDLASLTKIIGTTSSLMTLVDKGLIDLDKPLSDYLPYLKGSNKEGLMIREILAHQAKLRSWIPFHISTLEDGKPSKLVYSEKQSVEFPVRVAKDFFIHKDYRDTIFHKIAISDLLNRKRYIYSDLGFMLFAEMIDELTKLSYEVYLERTFFRPLGFQTMGFNPIDRYNPDRIVPTENDTLLRGQLLKGFVHDPGAAMLGGVAGHAGLFSNAAELAVFMQMLLDEGSYGGITFINPSTVKEFTTTQYAGNQNRRALGFDKPAISKRDNSNPACESASMLSFGHAGFTGTYAWADPQENLVYVFLSNRVNPGASNRKISELSIRTEIQQAIYNAIYLERFMDNNRLP
jgi:beta-N-acetylhexosaminidase